MFLIKGYTYVSITDVLNDWISEDLQKYKNNHEKQIRISNLTKKKQKSQNIIT